VILTLIETQNPIKTQFNRVIDGEEYVEKASKFEAITFIPVFHTCFVITYIPTYGT
jgi:hypothetical protein